MKKTLLSLSIILAGHFTYAQTTNTFPATGSVGIGTTTPSTKLDVFEASGTSQINIARFNNSTNGYYSAFSAAGSSSAVTSWTNGSQILEFTTNTAGKGIVSSYQSPLIFQTNNRTDRMIIDNTGKVGIGTSSPLAQFDVTTAVGSGGTSTMQAWNWASGPTSWGLRLDEYHTGSAIDQRFIQNLNGTNANVMAFHSGYVGIGTVSPSTTLDVGGSIQISGVSSATPSTGVSYGLFPYGGVGLGIYSGAVSPGQGIGIWTNPSGVPTEVMRILSGGNIGIGTTNPQNKLDVNGTIHSKQVNVDMNGWSDYVFKPKYHLPSLTEVKTYIVKNQHLPEMPSEKEVVKNGVNLGEMVKLQTKKIEELTLYLIEKDKQLTDQQKKSEQQDVRIAALEKALTKLTAGTNN